MILRWIFELFHWRRAHRPRLATLCLLEPPSIKAPEPWPRSPRPEPIDGVAYNLLRPYNLREHLPLEERISLTLEHNAREIEDIRRRLAAAFNAEKRRELLKIAEKLINTGKLPNGYSMADAENRKTPTCDLVPLDDE